jgi:hypothetical protein
MTNATMTGSLAASVLALTLIVARVVPAAAAVAGDVPAPGQALPALAAYDAQRAPVLDSSASFAAAGGPCEDGSDPGDDGNGGDDGGSDDGGED